jgi:hypothetical protein
MTGNVIAEHDDDVGLERIGALNDGMNAVQRHPGIAGMKVGNGRDLELQPGGPSRR